MKRLFVLIAAAVLLAVLFSSCGPANDSNPTISVITPTASVETPSDSSQTEPQNTTEQNTENVGTTEPVTAESTTVPPDNQKDKMLISADPDNPFILAVVNKYGVSSDRLVAFYASSMKTNGNLVFEFDGSTDINGKAIRNKSTLKNIYTVSPSPDFEAKKATGTAEEGNEYSEKESRLCKYFAEQVVFRFFGDDIQNA